MNKGLNHIFALCATLILLGGCVRESSPMTHPGAGRFLSVLPRLSRDAALATKVDETDPDIETGDLVNSRDDLRENYFGTLDVFVKRQDAGASTPWFKEYHLKAGDAGVVVDPDKYDRESLLDQAKQALASNWAAQGYEPGVSYDIYVTANNPHTAAGSAPASLSALQALTTNTPSIFRYYLAEEPAITDPIYYSNCLFSEKKEFLMDGKIEGWTIDPNKAEQVFDVDLERAAAKIILTVNFSDEKTLALCAEPTDANPHPEPEKDSQGRVVYASVKEYMQYVGRKAGVPRLKPVNFATTCSDIAFDSDPLPATVTPLFTAGDNYTTFQEGTSTDNTDNTFAFVTYSYPVDWSSDSSRIPYILLSVFYTRDSDGDQLRSYYRIPVCDERSVSSLDRNHVYIVDVQIASLGSSNDSFEAQDEELRIEYHVIPWTETNMTQEATTVKIADTKYLTILPTEYTLTGDNRQSVEMLWYASVSIDDGRFVDIDSNSLTVSYTNYLGNSVDIRGTVTKQVRNDVGNLVTATTANTDGTRDIVVTSTAPTSGAAGEQVIISLSPNGIIQVESDALESRAVKEISFTAYLKGTSGVDPVTITVRHFPLDNIQSFVGSWSSRWDGVGTIREYSFDPTADGWTTWDGFEDGVECTQAQYNNATEGKSTAVLNDGTPSDHVDTDYRVNYSTGGNNSTVQTQYRENVARGVDRYNTNGEANAALGADGYWYWGDTRTTNNATSNATMDWRGETAGGTGTRYRWTNYYRSQYKKMHYYARAYYRETVPATPSTGTWVEWGGQDGTTQEGIFTAKVFYNDQCYAISDHDSRGSGYSNLTNNHMYVLQITSTSSKYVLGRPVLDANYQSQDRVVSPAFMIASQLGAVSTTNSGTVASTHCGTYMEVGTDGKRYVGWRLPTKQEIEVIIGYQSGTYTSGVTMVTVLGGAYYWALDGTTANVPTGSGGSATTGYVRCVRDLTLEEVNSLNN